MGCARSETRSVDAPSQVAPDPRELRCRARASVVASRDCFEAGNAYDRGANGRPLRQDKAIELYAIGCKARAEDPSCGALKNEIVSLQLTMARRGEALALLETACRDGNLDLCNDLATAYQEGVGTSPRPSRALELFERTCHADEAGSSPSTLEVLMIGCNGIVALLRSGTPGIEKDETRAASAETRARELGRRLDTPRLRTEQAGAATHP